MAADVEESPLIKCVIVGPGGTGKTCALITYRSGTFPNEYVPISYDDSPGEIRRYEGKLYRLCLWDVCGGVCGGYNKQFSYFKTDVVLLFFDITRSKEKFETIYTYWKAGLTLFCPDVPVILVGSKVDMRGEKGTTFISSHEGKMMAEKIGATKYMEISSLQNLGVEELFSEVVRIGHKHHFKSLKKSNDVCEIL
jgi:Ras-related C3 botulinum toxin substrate 1